MRALILMTLLAFTAQLSLDPAAAQPNDSAKSRVADSGSAVVDLNRADAAELTRLPGIGPSLAERIVAYRTKRPFQSKRDLRRVKGIGFQKYTRIAPLVTVGTTRLDGKRTRRKRSRAPK